MAEGTITLFIRKMVFKAEPYLPQVPKPKKKIPLQVRLLWCGIALLIYMIMGQTPLFGATAPQFDFLAFARVIFASQQGTLVELGIGPIVTAGLLMQLLRGSDILKFDFKKPEERGIFQTATKMVTYVVIVAESIVYAAAVYGPGITDAYVLYVIIGISNSRAIDGCSIYNRFCNNYNIGYHLSSSLEDTSFFRFFEIKFENV